MHGKADSGNKPMKAKKRILTEEMLQEIVRRTVAAVQPEKIILFGSAARDEMGPDTVAENRLLDTNVSQNIERMQEGTPSLKVYKGIANGNTVILEGKPDLPDESPALVEIKPLDQARDE